MSTGTGCGNNTIEIAHARVVVGNLDIQTPFIQSISGSRERGTPQSRASCSLRINEEEVRLAQAGDTIYISFHGQAIFTGVVRRVQAVPTNRCAGEFFLNVQAEDPLFKLENRKISRRQKLEGLGTLAIISSKVDQPDRGFDTPPQQGGKEAHSFFGSPEGHQALGKTTNPRELPSLISPS